MMRLRIIALLLVSGLAFGWLTVPAYSARLADPITAEGEACAVGPDGTTYCYDLTLTFVVAGGEVTAYGAGLTPIVQDGTTYMVDNSFAFQGTFEGGDGGAVSGTWTGTSSMTFTDGVTVGTTSGGTWQGNLFANGEGYGTWQGEVMSQDGWWNISYEPSVFAAGLPAEDPGPSVPEEENEASVPDEDAAVVTEPQEEKEPPEPAVETVPGSESSSEPGPPVVQERPTDDESPGAEEAREAARDPLAPVSGAAVGTVLGGLLAYLASRTGSAAAGLEQQVQEYLAGQTNETAPGVDPGEFNQAALQWANDLERIASGMGVQGTVDGETPMFSAGFGTDVNIIQPGAASEENLLRSLSIYDSVLEMGGKSDPRLKMLGPLSAVKGFWDRWSVLADRRKDESLFYNFSTMLEAGTLETVKFFATKNPYIGTLDNAAGMIFGINPSDAICDKTSSLLEGEGMDIVITKQVYSGGQYGEKHFIENRKFMVEEARNRVKELQGMYERGEITPAEFHEQKKSAVRAWRMDYYELTGEQIEAQNEYWSTSWLR